MKVAVVTGSSRGIGLAIAKKLEEQGYLVVYSASSDRPDLSPYVRFDISKIEEIERLLQIVLDRYGRIDLLVNNAGVAPKVREDLLHTSAESFDRVLGINLKGTFYMCQKFANQMIRLKSVLPEYQPRIVNIGSISAFTSSTNRAEYCISKAGVGMVTALFADRLAKEGIPVLEVRPGIILTDMTRGVQEKYQTMIDNGLTPIPRMGTPEDVADCVWACASGLLDFATGQVIYADGGFQIRRL